MADSSEIIDAVFKDWAVQLDVTIEALTLQILTGQHGALPDQSDENAETKLKTLIRRELTSMMFGYCVTINGGSASADTGMVYLVDENGIDHTKLGLHSAFLGYLDSTRRPTV
ncbi:hypothetical protein [Nonomuraea maritima]|uniref:hypothetical protein n=1 Tax=Nonomuraea maritima TaxID=683260 RepID=UPI00371B7845